MWNFLKSPRPRKCLRRSVAPSWLAWCSFYLRASPLLHHLSLNNRHFYGLRSRLCTGARRLPWFAWACVTGGSLTACIPLVPHRIAARAPRLIVWARLLKSPWRCDPCRLPTASHDANLASWRAISLPVLPFLVPGLLCVPGPGARRF